MCSQEDEEKIRRSRVPYISKASYDSKREGYIFQVQVLSSKDDYQTRETQSFFTQAGTWWVLPEFSRVEHVWTQDVSCATHKVHLDDLLKTTSLRMGFKSVSDFINQVQLNNIFESQLDPAIHEIPE